MAAVDAMLIPTLKGSIGEPGSGPAPVGFQAVGESESPRGTCVFHTPAQTWTSACCPELNGVVGPPLHVRLHDANRFKILPPPSSLNPKP